MRNILNLDFMCLYGEFLIQSIFKSNQQKMERHASQIFRSPSHHVEEKEVLMTSPPKEAIIQQIWGTDQIVWLLNQAIEKKFDWEHEKLLLWNDNLNDSIYLPENIFVDQEAIKSELNMPSFQENYQEIISQKEEVKTPELFNALEPLSPVRICLEAQSQVKKQGSSQTIRCKCQKSKCLKLYCQCFRAGKQCNGCGCTDCKNHEQAGQQRKRVMKKIQQKQPTAFTDTSQYKGCKCTKSQCSKGYCQCFLNGHMCGKYCKCKDCTNCKSSRVYKSARSKKLSN